MRRGRWSCWRRRVVDLPGRRTGRDHARGAPTAFRRLGGVQRWRGLDGVPAGWGRSVVTVGVFDGVHRGHQQLIAAAVAEARARGLPSVLITFDPHPAEVVRPGSHPARLTSLRRRADLVAELGVDAFLVLPFTIEFARMSPAEFAHEVLVERLHTAAVVVGRNFTFGHRAAGTVAGAHRARHPVRVRGRRRGADHGQRPRPHHVLLDLRARLHRRRRRGGRGRRARPPAPGRGRGGARLPAGPPAGVPHGEHRQPALHRAARGRRLRRALRDRQPPAARGGVRGVEPDVLRHDAHRRGLRARRRRGLLRPRGGRRPRRAPARAGALRRPRRAGRGDRGRRRPHARRAREPEPSRFLPFRHGNGVAGASIRT